MFFRKQSKEKVKKTSGQIVKEYAQALFYAVLLAIVIRGFLFEPFKIPSESMLPTLLVGDHIFVKRFAYGLRVPFTKYWLTEFDGPQRGDIVVFNYPENERIDFIKRVMGLPGDTITMKDGVLFINGKEIIYQSFEPTKATEANACVMSLSDDSQKIVPKNLQPFPFFLKNKRFEEKLETLDNGLVHMVQRSRDNPINMNFEITVPERSYFVMGDNRDLSHDSRFWGFVPRENLKGKAIYIWLALDNEKTHCAGNFFEPFYVNVGQTKILIPNVRWDRFGREII
jgi:signal peptidase I